MLQFDHNWLSKSSGSSNESAVQDSNAYIPPNVSVYRDHLFEVLLIGDEKVGKSCTLVRYIDDFFDPNYTPTIGVDNCSRYKKLSISSERVELKLWDSTGQSKYNTEIRKYYKQCNGIILCFDITNEQSFETIKDWINEIEKEAAQDPALILVGTKSDLADKRTVSKSKAQVNFTYV